MAVGQPPEINIRELLLWKKKIPTAHYANLPSRSGRPNPVCLNGVVYTQVAAPNIVAALDINNGNFLWRTNIGRHGAECLTIAADRIHTRTDLEQVCLHCENGKVLWKYKPEEAHGEMFYALPAIARKRLYTGDTKGTFHCLNAASGNLLWKRQLSSAGHMINGNPIVVGDKVIVGTNIPTVTALDCNTGKLAWKRRIDSSSVSPAVKIGHNVVLSSCQTLYQLNPEDGTLLNKWRRRGWDIKGFVVSRKSVIVHLQAEYKPGTISASARPPSVILKLKNWKIDWEIEAPEFSTSMSLLGERLCVSGFGELNLLSMATGRVVHRIIAGGIGSGHLSNPARCNDRFYVQSFNGVVFAATLPA